MPTNCPYLIEPQNQSEVKNEMNGDLHVDESTFKEMTPEQRDWVTLQTVLKCQGERQDCNQRMCALEKKQRYDTAKSSFMGLLGGMLAVVILWIKEVFTK